MIAKRAAVRSLFGSQGMSLYGRRTCDKKKSTSPLHSNRTVIPYISPVPPATPPEVKPDDEPNYEGSQEEGRKQPLATILYVSGASEQIRKTYEKFNLRILFKSGSTFLSLLTEVKDPKEKLAGVVYQIPFQCSKVYVERCESKNTWMCATRRRTHGSLPSLSISGTSDFKWTEKKLGYWTEPPGLSS